MSYFIVIPAFPLYLAKSGFEVELFKVELAAFQEFFPVFQRSFIQKRRTRKSFSANESYHFFSDIKDLKPVAVTYAFLYQIL